MVQREGTARWYSEQGQAARSFSKFQDQRICYAIACAIRVSVYRETETVVRSRVQNTKGERQAWGIQHS